MNIFEKLSTRFGPQHWWPAQTKFEVIVGCFLTQNTSWSQVEKSISNLKKKKLLSVDGISKGNEDLIKECITPAGYFNQKCEMLKKFCTFVEQNYAGDLNALLKKPLKSLRPELLSLHGVGPETADSILLYASNQPSFVIDAYTKRIMERLGFEVDWDYDSLKDWFETFLPKNTKLFNEFHALLVQLAKQNCLKTEPLCETCPLQLNCKFGKKV